MASLCWSLLLVLGGVIYADFGILYAVGQRTNPLFLEVIYVASFFLALPVFCAGISFAYTKRAKTALKVATWVFFIIVFLSINI